jgi:uncharacterized phage protein (TIGR02218 family)
MRTISTSFQTHLESEVQTVALCWKIQRKDGTIYRYTDHDAAIVYDGSTYTPIDSGSPSNYRQNAALSPANIDFNMVFGTGSGRDSEIRAGLFDYAEMWTFKINWADPSTASGIVKLAYGRLGEVEIKDNQARIELRSLTQLLSVPIGRIYTPECNASLGDTRCTIATSSTVYTKTGTVSAVTDNRVFAVSGDAAGQVDNFFNYGKITFGSGDNNGIAIQIEDYTTLNVVTLYEAAPYTLSTGVTFSAIAGCDRRFETCKTRFNNKDNFRGFPHIPGMDKALTVPNNQQWATDSSAVPTT